MTEGKEPTGPVIPSSETEHSSDSSSVDIDIDSDSATDISVKMIQNDNSAYDLTPFTPDEEPVPVLDRSQEEGGGGGGVDVDADDKDHSGTFNFDFNTYCASENVHIIEEEEDEVEEKVQEGQESQEEINKREEEGLLQSGNNDDQLARIAMYYARVEDSDSDDDDEYKNEDEDKDEDEDKFEWGNTCTQDEISEHQMYAGLSDQMEEVDTMDTMDTIDTITACSTSTGPTSTIEEENGLVSLVESLQFEKTSIEDETTIEFPCFPSVDNVNASLVEVEECDNSMELKNSSSLSITQDETVVKKDSMSKAVPLIKPPSAEKMQAYLLSKGLASAGPKSLLKKLPTSTSETVEDSDRSSQESPAFASFAAFED